MRYLIISLLLLGLSACSVLPTTKNLIGKISQETINNPYFSNEKIDYVYKAKINAGNNNFGGLLILKKIKDKHHRVVFTTEFGNKIFDFEFINTNFKVNYITDKLDKKFIINALKKDFQLLVNEYNKATIQFRKDKKNIYKTTLNNKDNYYVLSKENNTLTKIVMASKRKEKMTISFRNIENNISKNIELKHHNFNMTIQLNYIN